MACSKNKSSSEGLGGPNLCCTTKATMGRCNTASHDSKSEVSQSSCPIHTDSPSRRLSLADDDAAFPLPESFSSRHSLADDDNLSPLTDSLSNQVSLTKDDTTSPLVQLPSDLKHLMLTSLPDIDTLKSLTQAHRPFAQLFSQAKKSILSSIMNRQIDEQVMPVALLVREARNLESLSKDSVVEFLSSITCPTGRPEWTMPNALSTSRLHATISTWAKQYLSANDMTPSARVISRVERTIYWFELFCFLFRRRDYGEDEEWDAVEAKYYFASLLEPWECEMMMEILTAPGIDGLFEGEEEVVHLLLQTLALAW